MTGMEIAMLLNVGSQLLPGLFGDGGAEERENAREDEYNANSGQHTNNFLRDYIMQPIGPQPGMPTLNDPEAFEAYDPMNPMAYGNPGNTYQDEQNAAIYDSPEGQAMADFILGGGGADPTMFSPGGPNAGGAPGGVGQPDPMMFAQGGNPVAGVIGVPQGGLDIATLLSLFGGGQQSNPDDLLRGLFG